MTNEDSKQRESESESVALDVWLEFLGRANGDEDSAFEELTEQHPDIAVQLRRLRSRWRENKVVLPAMAASIQERLRSLANPLPRGTRFRRDGEIARGGMGVIHKVRDLELDRSLALKEMIVGPAERHPVAASRFLEEAQITAQLDHPGVVPIHEMGMDAAGRIYFAMKLVRGRDLRTILDLLRQGSEEWNQTRVLGVLLKVCEAMAYAHSKGVIHRDLKPANVMVGHFGEVYVMDWGLARALGREDIHDLRIKQQEESVSVQTSRRSEREDTPASLLVTMDGDIVGTPSYMPPEQARGEIQLLSPRSDVYSVGAMIYHLLTGQAPFVVPGVRVSNHTALARLLDGPPTAVHELNPEAPEELVAICEKAMARDPGKRYRDTLELGGDLRAFIEHRVVRAYQTGAIAELTKWVKRNRALAASVGLAALLLVLGLTLTVIQWRRVERSERRALDSEALLEKDRSELLGLSAQQTLDVLVEEADRLWPALPENIERYRSWLQRAESLVAQLPTHQSKVAELRAKARRWTAEEEAAFRATNPRAQTLESLRRKLGFLKTRRTVLETGKPADPSAAELGLDLTSFSDDSQVLNKFAWPLVNPDREVFGGEAKGLVLARHALELSSVEHPTERPSARDTLAWALFALGRFSEARAEDEQAVEEAEPKEKPQFEALLAKLKRSIDAELDPKNLAKANENLAALEAEVAALQANAEWVFDSDEDGWWHTQLEVLIQGIQSFADEKTGIASSGVSDRHGWGMKRRLESALALRDGFGPSGEYARAWSEALPRIRAAYPGLALTPQMGLVPLGPDKDSGLWEFAHLQTGKPAVRAASGKLVLTEETGLVFVLLPGGKFRMGAQGVDASLDNYDAKAERGESPVHWVTLSPFFLSKYEMTQGQWLRFTGRNPSPHAETTQLGGTRATALHPVARVSWDTCVETLGRLDLVLPTEAQWEYGARAGTSSVWWTGDDSRLLQGAGNVADRFAKEHGSDLGWTFEEGLDDGYLFLAPVGSFRANAFGLHDVVGNVAEWCHDWYGGYGLPVREGDGERSVPAGAALSRVMRGGAYASSVDDARTARRWLLPSTTFDTVGLRPARSISP